MRTGISLQALSDKINGNRELKHDFVADTRQMRMTVDALGEHGNRMPVLEVENQGRFPMLPVALRQLASHTKVPSDYLDRMIERAPELAGRNVTEWLKLDPARRLVRAFRHEPFGAAGGVRQNARAFLSDRYQRIDHEDIADVVEPVLLSTPDLKIVSCEITERRLYIQAVTARKTLDVKVGDPVQAGVVIRNSEVGLGSVSIDVLDWRLVCLNGMISPGNGYKRNHVGRRVEDGEDLNAIYRDDTLAADDRAILLKVRDTVAAALDEVRFAARVEKMSALAQSREVENPIKAVEVLSKKLGLAERERPGVLKSLTTGADLTAWGLLNAITHQAHTADYDRAVEFETMGGRLLNLPASEWREVLQAA